MRIIEQSVEMLDLGSWSEEYILEKIEKAGRTAYKSEDKITKGSAEKFVRMLIKSGHHSVLEHHNITMKFITNRGVSHELVRHRISSYTQESTRYVKYGDDMEFIKPVWFDSVSEKEQLDFINFCIMSQGYYDLFIGAGWRPEQAREILPNAIKTEIVHTANLREWRYIFNLRCAKDAHPQIRDLMRKALKNMGGVLPIVFEDLVEKYLKKESK